METQIGPHLPPASVSAGPRASRTLREATQEFESLFVAQLMQTMRRTALEGGLMTAGSGQQLFREMLDQETARQVAYSGGFGIGEILYRQLAPDEASGIDGQQVAGRGQEAVGSSEGSE
jgi:flagellar protein FlgJ